MQDLRNIARDYLMMLCIFKQIKCIKIEDDSFITDSIYIFFTLETSIYEILIFTILLNVYRYISKFIYNKLSTHLNTKKKNEVLNAFLCIILTMRSFKLNIKRIITQEEIRVSSFKTKVKLLCRFCLVQNRNRIFFPLLANEPLLTTHLLIWDTFHNLA